MKENQSVVNVISFMEKSTREKYYPQLNNALDHQLRMLRSNGIGINWTKASWHCNARHPTTTLAQRHPRVPFTSGSLECSIFFNGQNFSLRGVQEHHNLLFSQITFASDPDRYVYSEFGSKNHSGGINDTSEGKVVPIVSTGKHNCHVRTLNFYLSKVPQHVWYNGGKFYLSPLPFTPTGNRPWSLTNPCL